MKYNVFICNGSNIYIEELYQQMKRQKIWLYCKVLQNEIEYGDELQWT